jgi:hypothetical protein
MTASLLVFGLLAPIAMMGAVPHQSFTQTRTVHKRKKPVRKHKMTNSQEKDLAPGQWGGNGISLVVEAASSHIGYDCASGEISEKLTLDRNGNFSARGFHVPRTPGPDRLDNPPNRKPATYTGHVSGETMTLKVVLTGDGTLIGEYQLERGRSGRLHRCL